MYSTGIYFMVSGIYFMAQQTRFFAYYKLKNYFYTMIRLLFSAYLLLFICACNNNSSEIVTNISSSPDTLRVDTVISKTETVAESSLSALGLEMFSNIEQVDYSVPIPLSEYKQDFKNDYERGHFVFLNKKNKKFEMEVIGMIRSETKTPIEEYFKNTFPVEDEEQGKVVESKTIVAKTNCFYAKGYWSNFIWESRFLEVYWLRPDDVVKVSVLYDVNDTTIWNQRLQQMIQMDSYRK
jgi:hypothetical protein